MEDVNCVTISLEEYFALRTKAEENIYLADRLGQFEQRCRYIEDKLFEIERKIQDGRA